MSGDEETQWNLLMRQSHEGVRGYGAEWNRATDMDNWLARGSGPEWGWFFAAYVDAWTPSAIRGLAP